MTDDNDLTPDGYRIVRPMAPAEPEVGIQCGECGLRMKHGEIWSYYCPINTCPLFGGVTC
jgi:hypothetical protein